MLASPGRKGAVWRGTASSGTQPPAGTRPFARRAYKSEISNRLQHECHVLTLNLIFVLTGLLVWAVIHIFRSAPTEPSRLQIRFSDLWKWRGTVDRGTYALVGVVGFAIKHNIDRLIANRLFGRPFTPFNYWIPPVQAIRIDSLSTTDARFLATMVSIALPFVWIGLAMTVRRLRSANLPLSLVVLFFVPLMNLLFFVVLSLI